MPVWISKPKKEPEEVIPEKIIEEEVKPVKKPEKIEDSELKKLLDSNKKLQEIISESNKRQEDILKVLQAMKKVDIEHEKSPEQIEAEKLLNKTE